MWWVFRLHCIVSRANGGLVVWVHTVHVYNLEASSSPGYYQTHSQATTTLIPKPPPASFPGHHQPHSQATTSLIPRPPLPSFPGHHFHNPIFHLDRSVLLYIVATSLNSRHPQYNGQFWNSQLSFHSRQYLSNLWIADTPLLRITDSFCGPNCMQTILSDPDLANTCRSFQQDCQPSLL